MYPRGVVCWFGMRWGHGVLGAHIRCRLRSWDVRGSWLALRVARMGVVISMPNPPAWSTLVPDPTPIYTEYLHRTSPRTYTVLRIGPLFSLPPSVPMPYLLLVSSLSIAYLRPFIITMLSHMSPFVTIPPPYAFSILRPLPTCSSYLSTCFSIPTSDPQSERHSI